MSCKDAIEILKDLALSYETGSFSLKAIKMAITALELQDGNLYLRDVPGNLSIGLITGNVYMGGYGDE